VFVLAWAAVLLYLARRGRTVTPAAGGHETILRFANEAEVVAFNLAFSLFSVEASLRAYGALCGRSPMIGEALDAYRLAPGQEYGNGLRGNQLGYPGPDFCTNKQPGVFRIAALGDSFAVGPAVPFDDNYLTRLEKLLPGIEVYNFGVSGTGPREYWTVLNQDVWTYHPDLVLVSIFVGNDVTESLATPRHLDPRQSATYLLLTRGSRVLLERYRVAGPISFNRKSEACASGRPNAHDSGLRLNEVPTPFEDSGRATPLGRATPNGNATPNGRVTPIGLSEATFAEIEARRLEVCLKMAGPGLERKWQRALAYMDRMIEACRQRRVPLAFVLIPDEFQVNPAVLAVAIERAGRTASDVDLDLPQRRLAGFLADRSIPCLDLLPALRRSTATYAPRDTHWNMRGNHLAAREISTWLAAQPGLEINRLASWPPKPAP